MLFSGNENEQERKREIEKLIAGIASGDQSAFEALYRETSSSVYGFALSLLKSGHDAEDVMQEVYLAVYHKAGQYSAQAKPMAWILTITKNLCLMKLRSTKRKETVSPEELEETLRHEGFSGMKEDEIFLKGAMSALGEEERQIVILHAVAGMRHREIAGLLKMPLATELSKYRRGLAKLKKILEEESR